MVGQRGLSFRVIQILLAGLILTGCPLWTCTDNDGDGYGNPASGVCAFSEPDCDDSDPGVNPGEIEICDNGIDGRLQRSLPTPATRLAEVAVSFRTRPQEVCYDGIGVMTCPSAGQSFLRPGRASTASNLPSYAVGGDGLTVRDNLTGLTWTRACGPGRWRQD